MELFRTKLVVKEAMEWTGSNVEAIAAFVGANGLLRDFSLIIKTMEGELIASPGDWIVKGVKGEFYPCKPDVFAETYERVNNETQNVSDERLAEKLHYAEIAEEAYVKSGLNPEAELWGEDVSLLRELTALRANHKRLVEVLDAIPINEAQSFSRDDVRAALAEARKLEGEYDSRGEGQSEVSAKGDSDETINR